MNYFKQALDAIKANHEQLLTRQNEKEAFGNGIYDRFVYPIITAAHAPIHWRYDLNPETGEKKTEEPLEMEEERVYRQGDVVQWNEGEAEVEGIGKKKGVETVTLILPGGKKVTTTKASLDVQQQGEGARRDL